MTLTTKLNEATIGVTSQEAAGYRQSSESFQVEQTPRQLYETVTRRLKEAERFNRENGITFDL